MKIKKGINDRQAKEEKWEEQELNLHSIHTWEEGEGEENEGDQNNRTKAIKGRVNR